jgi:hypothetical protein
VTVKDITRNNVWTCPSKRKQQNAISLELNKKKRAMILHALPNNITSNRALTIDEAAKRRQGIANDCKDTGRFLSANPAFGPNNMNNAVFNYSFYTRNLLPIMGSRKYCICGEEMDCLGQHSLVCQVSSIRSKIRNPAHAKLSRGLKALLAQRQKCVGYSLANGEPMITDYFETNLETNEEDNQNSSSIQINENFMQNITNKRADIALLYGDKTQLIDVTFTATNIQGITEYEVGKAASIGYTRKLHSYRKHFKTENVDIAELIIFSVETSGAIHPKSKDFLREIVAHTEAPDKELGRIMQTLSVQIQTARAEQIHKSKYLYSLDVKPTFPYVNGPIPLPPEPTMHLSNRVRRIAISMPPERPQYTRYPNQTDSRRDRIQATVNNRDNRETMASNSNSNETNLDSNANCRSEQPRVPANNRDNNKRIVNEDDTNDNNSKVDGETRQDQMQVTIIDRGNFETLMGNYNDSEIHLSAVTSDGQEQLRDMAVNEENHLRTTSDDDGSDTDLVTESDTKQEQLQARSNNVVEEIETSNNYETRYEVLYDNDNNSLGNNGRENNQGESVGRITTSTGKIGELLDKGRILNKSESIGIGKRRKLKIRRNLPLHTQ